MANELLKNSEGEAVPQKLAENSSLTANDLNGDDSNWVIFQDPAQGGGSTLQDIVSQLQNGNFEIGEISDSIVIEADDGNGNVAEIQRTNKALHVYLGGQANNISVDLEADNAGIATESTLSTALSELENIKDAVTGETIVEGNISSDETDVGKPVKVGGRATSSASEVDEGDRVGAWFDQKGRLHVLDENALQAGFDSIEIYGSPDGGSTQTVISVDNSGRQKVRHASTSKYVNSSLSNNIDTVKNSGATLESYHVTNEANSFVYLHLYSGTGNSIGDSADLSLGIPPETGATLDTSAIDFASGLEVAVTASPSPTANDSPPQPAVVNLMYI